MLERICFVLVRTQSPGNIGSVARSMMNMGLDDLVLVAPECDVSAHEARWRAMRGAAVLDAARTVPTIADALRGCTLTFATSAKGGFYRRQVAMTPADAAAHCATLPADSRIAIVFGPEDQGLTQEEILEFDRLIEIPAHPRYNVLNMSMAATVIAYEYYLASLRASGQPLLPPHDPLATDDRTRVMYEKLYASLEQIGFFDYQQNADHLKFALRRLFGRAQLSVNECDILIGMAQQIRSFAQRGRRGDQSNSDAASNL